MTFKFDHEIRIPMYVQLAGEMRRRIKSNEWKIGESVGNLFNLADELKCSFGTVRAAEEVLVKEGLLSEVRPGMATRVIGVPADEPPAMIDNSLVKLKKLQRDLAGIIAEIEAA